MRRQCCQQRSLGSLNGHIEEIYSGHTVVKAYNGERAAREEFNKRNESLRVNGFKAQCLSGLMPPLMGFIGNLGYVAVCVVGATLVIRGRIEFGVIVAFMMYMAVPVMAASLRSIMTSAPSICTTELTSAPKLFFSDWPIVSTSFVTRERISPVEVRLKYDIGSRLIFAEISARIFLATRCVTVVSVQLWTDESSILAA